MSVKGRIFQAAAPVVLWVAAHVQSRATMHLPEIFAGEKTTQLKQLNPKR